MNPIQVKKHLERFLIEDLGNGDLSAELIFDKNYSSAGKFIAKCSGILAGTDIIKYTYETYGANVDVKLFINDGAAVNKGDTIAEVSGPVTALLSCERIILNLMQRMSGIATTTTTAVELLDDSSIRICDTRKTIPGLRIFEKYAVTCGGGFNHRVGLYDGIMLKDNHIAFFGGITNAVSEIKKKIGHMVKIEVETETKEQVIEAVNAGADVIMFDNRTPNEIRELVKLVPNYIITEASGGIGLNNISQFKGTGVNYISIGALTHSAMPLDISFNSTGVLKA